MNGPCTNDCCKNEGCKVDRKLPPHELNARRARKRILTHLPGIAGLPDARHHHPKEHPSPTTPSSTTGQTPSPTTNSPKSKRNPCVLNTLPIKSLNTILYRSKIHKPLIPSRLTGPIE